MHLKNGYKIPKIHRRQAVRCKTTKQKSLHNSFVTLMEVINRLYHIILGCTQIEFL